jgi:hypothetical protein
LTAVTHFCGTVAANANVYVGTTGSSGSGRHCYTWSGLVVETYFDANDNGVLDTAERPSLKVELQCLLGVGDLSPASGSGTVVGC